MSHNMKVSHCFEFVFLVSCTCNHVNRYFYMHNNIFDNNSILVLLEKKFILVLLNVIPIFVHSVLDNFNNKEGIKQSSY